MKVEISDIDQRYSLVSKEVTNYVVLVLPSGRQVRALVDDASIADILRESDPASAARPVEDRAVDPLPTSYMFPDIPDIEETPLEEGMVDWQKVPELPEEYKQVFAQAGVSRSISLGEYNEIVAQVSERLEKLPRAGEVKWDEGPRRETRRVPPIQRGSVMTDEAGNPIPPGGIVEADPGELIDDDDGVAAL